MRAYQTIISDGLQHLGRVDVDPRHVEAWMRAENATLDGMSPAQFVECAVESLRCVDNADYDLSEKLAKSFGLAVQS